MKTDAKTDFKALEALRKAAEDAMIPSRVSIGYDLYSYLEAVLKERTGYTCFLWLLDMVLDEVMWMPEIIVHSQNPVGAENIRKHYQNYISHLG